MTRKKEDKRELSYCGELGHQNMTLTNDHSQNNEMVGNIGRNRVKADEPKEAEEVGIKENTNCVMQMCYT